MAKSQSILGRKRDSSKIRPSGEGPVDVSQKGYQLRNPMADQKLYPNGFGNAGDEAIFQHGGTVQILDTKVVNGKKMYLVDGDTVKVTPSYQKGGVIEDNRGQWDHPGEVTKINSPHITMKGVSYPILGISDAGHQQLMMPGHDYSYYGKSVTEYPMIAQKGTTANKERAERLYKQIAPSSFIDVSNYVNYATGKNRDWYADPRSEEAWKMYLGLNDKPKYIAESKYKNENPAAKFAPNTKFYKIDQEAENQLVDYFKDKLKPGQHLTVSERELESLDNIDKKSGYGPFALFQNFNVGKGQDKQGEYIYYNDTYDFPGPMQMMLKGNPYEFYNKIYLPKGKSKEDFDESYYPNKMMEESMKGWWQKEKGGKIKANGGTIYTSDKNNPALKAYTDSSTLYKYGQDYIKKVLTTENRGQIFPDLFQPDGRAKRFIQPPTTLVSSTQTQPVTNGTQTTREGISVQADDYTRSTNKYLSLLKAQDDAVLKIEKLMNKTGYLNKEIFRPKTNSGKELKLFLHKKPLLQVIYQPEVKVPVPKINFNNLKERQNILGDNVQYMQEFESQTNEKGKPLNDFLIQTVKTPNGVKTYKRKDNNSPWIEQMKYGGKIKAEKGVVIRNADGTTTTYDPSSEEYRKLYESGQIGAYDESTNSFYPTGSLPEVTVNAIRPKSFKDFNRRYSDQLAKDIGSDFSAGSFFQALTQPILQYPQAALTYALDPKSNVLPSKALGIDEEKHPWLSMGVNALADPANLVGAGLVDDALKISSKLKQIKTLKQLPGSGNAVDFSKYLTQEEAVAARGNRLISQKNKQGWNEQLTPELEQRLSTAVERHNPASDLLGESLGVNLPGRTGTEVSKNAISKQGIPLNEANKSRIAAHEVGHYYSNSPAEGKEWVSHFDFSKLSQKSRDYLMGKGWKGRGTDYANEVRERAAQLKDYIAQKNGIPLNEDFIITESMLDDAIKNYVSSTGLDNSMSKMLGALTDKKGLLKTMNKYALGTIPAVIGAGALQEKKYGGTIKVLKEKTVNGKKHYLIDDNKPEIAQEGKNVKTYTPKELETYRNYVSNYNVSSDPTFDKSEISPELNAAEPGTLCINGICSLVQKGGLQFSNPQTKDKRYMSNIAFSDAVKQDKEDWYKLSNYGLTDYMSGDIIMFKDSKNKVPHHAELIRKNPDNTYTLIDNSGNQDWRETAYTKQTLDNLINSDLIQVMRPGYKNDYAHLMEIKQKNDSQKINPNFKPKYNDELNTGYVYRTGAYEDKMNNEAMKQNPTYTPTPKNKNQYSESVFNKLNDEAYITDVAKSYNVSKKDAQDIIKYTYGIIKQETDFSPKSSLEGMTEYLLSKFRKDRDLNKKYDFDPSSGYGQIRFNNLTADQKIKYGIRTPQDLYDYNKSQSVLEDIIAKNYKYVLGNFDKIKKNHPSLTKENALQFALYMQNAPQMVMNPKYLDKVLEKSIKNGYISEKDTPTGKDINIKGKSKEEVRKMLQLNLDKGSYPNKVINYADQVFQPTEIIRPSKKTYGGKITKPCLECGEK